jgi:hypothetical protein
MRKTNPISPTAGEVGRGRPTYQGPKSAEQSQFSEGRPASRGRSCETNPICAGGERLTEEVVQNEAKPGETGVCGQRQLWYGARLGRGVKRAKRTQFRPPGGGRRRANAQNKPNLAAWFNIVHPAATFLGQSMGGTGKLVCPWGRG